MVATLSIAPPFFLTDVETLAQGFESGALLQEEHAPVVAALADSYAASGLAREELPFRLGGPQIASAIRARPKTFQTLLSRVQFQLFGNGVHAHHQPNLEPQIEFLSRYCILSELKQTKYAIVFWAMEIESGRVVIIKVFRRDGTGEGELRLDKFKRELKVLQTISHPNIVKMREFEERNDGKHEGLDSILFLGDPYIIFEWEGTSLENLAEGRNSILPLGWPFAKEILLQLASALSTMHKVGLVHRDLCANNVLLKKGKGGLWRAKLCDFGNTCDKDHCDDDLVCGTVAYMAPEQLRGEPLNPCTDIYGLGVLLFQLLTNRLPFIADSAYGMGLQHVEDPPPPLDSVRPGLSLSPDVQRIVSKALAKKPEDRFQTMAEMAKTIKACK